MAGHMGHRRCTVKNLKIYKIMPEENALVVVGSVPGPKKSWLRVRDSLFKPLPRIPPFPTFIKGETQLDAVCCVCLASSLCVDFYFIFCFLFCFFRSDGW